MTETSHKRGSYTIHASGHRKYDIWGGIPYGTRDRLQMVTQDDTCATGDREAAIQKNEGFVNAAVPNGRGMRSADERINSRNAEPYIDDMRSSRDFDAVIYITVAEREHYSSV